MDGGRFSIVLTTNFDDLVADALYLFTAARPLVIHHESLANFIRPTRTRPLVVKLHGDAIARRRRTPRRSTASAARARFQQRDLGACCHDRGLGVPGLWGPRLTGSRICWRGCPRPAHALGGLLAEPDRSSSRCPFRAMVGYSAKGSWVQASVISIEAMLTLFRAHLEPSPSRKAHPL